jgi:hypothetical protein
MLDSEEDEDWFCPTDPPDFWRYFGSWAIGESIWTPCWKDAYPPAPCLCSAWGGYGETSRLVPALALFNAGPE